MGGYAVKQVAIPSFPSKTLLPLGLILSLLGAHLLFPFFTQFRIDEKASSKIFEIFSKASEVSDTAGLGLYLVKLAVEKLEGSIRHSKTSDGYTKFTVELPV